MTRYLSQSLLPVLGTRPLRAVCTRSTVDHGHNLPNRIHSGKASSSPARPFGGTGVQQFSSSAVQEFSVTAQAARAYYLMCTPEMARAMMRRWISLVPSKIV